MHLLLPIVVFLLMVSVGMSLEFTAVAANWRGLRWINWFGLVIATFIIPPALALLIANLFHLTLGETTGLFMIGVAPGAPLLTRNLARKGFHPHMAASYQVWAALMIPVMIPLLVAIAGKLYGRDIWIPPMALLRQIVLKQFLPLSIGMMITWFAPARSQRLQPRLNMLGNILFVVLIVVILFKLGSALKAITPLVPIASLLLCVGSIAAILALPFRDVLVRQTFAVCNANRHVGLALLLSGQYLHETNALPIMVCYAVLAPLVMFAYVKYYATRPQQKQNS